MPLPTPPTPKEIVDRWDYHVQMWRPIRDEGRTDMRYLMGDPWEPKERESRKGRFCLDFDELSQYVNQLINGVRQNKRAPKVTPVGNGANDQTAEMLAGLIKAIGYKSNADAAGITALENAASRSYGFEKITREYLSDNSDDQELRVRVIPNPDVISLDPDAKEPDFSDGEDAFEIDRIKKGEFKRRFPKASVVDFTSEHMKQAPIWIRENDIQIATYWKAHISKRTRYRLDSQEEPEVWSDELPEGSGVDKNTSMLERKGLPSVKVRSQREKKDRFVVAYLTNGIEILETTPWTITVTNPQTGKKTTGGRLIPINPLYGKELWIDDGGGSKRVWQSLIRLARTPYMAYCYARTAQVEAIQLTSKTPYWAYEGQFENHEEEMKTLNRVPVAFQYVKPTVEGAPPNTLLPFPQRPSYIPEVQQLEVFAQAARRAIQAAVGQSNPQAQRDHSAPLSGVAQEKFKEQGDLTTFHFIDHYDAFLENRARILKDNIPVIYDAERQVAIVSGDEKSKVITLNAQKGQVDEQGQPIPDYPTDEGDHEVTISVGPSMDSERDTADQFADTLLTPQLVTMALQNPQSTSAKLAALSIRLKNLGAIGDSMANLFDPEADQKNPIPPQVQQAMQQMQQQYQQAVTMVGHLQQELKEKSQIAEAERLNKRVIAADRNRTDLLKIGAENAAAQLDAEMRAIEKLSDMLHESELAPGPDDGSSQGLHPSSMLPPAGQAASPAQNGAGPSEPAPQEQA